MEIEVKASQVVKTGTNKNGPWELIRVTSADGTEYTTFDKKAKHLGAGAVIDIGEVEIKGNKISFKEIVKVVKEGQAVAVNGGGYKADPAKLASEENRSRMHAIKELWIADKFDDNSPEVIKLRKWLMDDAPKAPQPSLEPPQAAPKDKPDDNLMDLPIKNLGDLFTACQKHFKLIQSNTLKELGLTAKEEIADVQDAWRQIVSARI